jgi:molybdate transport system substrate-binding protein
MARVLTVLIVIALWALPARAPQAASPITVAAAVSLSDALNEAAEEYGQGRAAKVYFNFAASNVLARQIVNGAPVDLFISADEQQMEVLATAGLLTEGTRLDLLSNQLAVIVPDDRPRTFNGIRDLLDPEIKRIALGDPAAVPAGVYAKQYLEAKGIWAGVEPRVVPAVSARAALSAVESGAADAGIVYRTDAVTARRAIVAWLVPVDRGPRITYPAAVIRRSKVQTEAKAFLAFLQSDAASRIFTRFGFTPAR